MESFFRLRRRAGSIFKRAVFFPLGLLLVFPTGRLVAEDSRNVATKLVAEFDAKKNTPGESEFVRLEKLGFDKWYDMYGDLVGTRAQARTEYNRLLRESKQIYEQGPVRMEDGSVLMYFFPEEALPGILKSGILNQHQTGASLQGGANNAKRRALLEDGVISVEKNYNASKKNPNHYVRPKMVILDPSGVRPDLKRMVKEHGMNDGKQYGSLIAVLKDEVKERSTWSRGDSYGPAGTSSWNPPPIESLRKDVFDIRRPRSYFEAQVWGELDLRDIKEFWVAAALNPQTLELLKSAGLPIFFYTETPADTVYSYIKRSRQVFAGDKDKIAELGEPARDSWVEFVKASSFGASLSAKVCSSMHKKIVKTADEAK